MYLRMRFRREGGCADYFLLFYVKQVIKIGFPIRIIPDQQRPVIDRIVVYGFFYIQNRDGKLRLIPVPSVLCVSGVLRFYVFPPLSVFCQQQHLVQVGRRLHLYCAQTARHALCVLGTFVFPGQVFAEIHRLRVGQNCGKRVLRINQRFQISFRRREFPRCGPQPAPRSTRFQTRR